MHSSFLFFSQCHFEIMASARHATYFPHSDKSIPGSTFWPPDLKERSISLPLAPLQIMVALLPVFQRRGLGCSDNTYYHIIPQILLVVHCSMDILHELSRKCMRKISKNEQKRAKTCGKIDSIHTVTERAETSRDEQK